jgi:tetraacyldisaccharide 4'-kinase
MLGWLYRTIGDLRNSLYENGFFKSYSLGAPTISVGNITMGGTGKTPLVAYIAEILAENGKKVCILSRGYGRNDPAKRVLVSDAHSILAGPAVSGDEPFELAQKLINKAVIVSDADRAAAAAWAKEKFDIDVFVLDDAFQHRRAQRDLDIVCIDATNPFGNGITNMLRESPKSLGRVDAVVITRADLGENIDDLRQWIRHLGPKKIFTARSTIARVTPVGEPNQVADLKDKKVLAFCAIGNPGSFFEQLKRTGLNLAAEKTFRDHHYYSRRDIDELQRTARESDAGALLTTVKDAGKLAGLNFEIPCYQIESKLIIDEETAFRDLIYSVLS